MAVGKTVTVGFDWSFGLPTNKKNVDLLKIDVLFFFATRFATHLLFEII